MLSCLILSSFVGLCEGLLLSLSSAGKISLLSLVKLITATLTVIAFLAYWDVAEAVYRRSLTFSS